MYVARHSLKVFSILCSVVWLATGFSPVKYSSTFATPELPCVTPRQPIALFTFYDDFEGFGDDEDDDEDDDDDEYDDMDGSAVEDFRSRMGTLFGDSSEEGGEGSITSVDELISFATGKSEAPSTDWANPTDKIQGGVVLVANPARFCADFGGKKATPSPALLSKFGLTLPPPADLGADRRADLLPVLALLDHRALGSHAVLLNRRTGYLLGDLEQQPTEDGTGSAGAPPRLGAFMIQPLWFGGTAASGSDENASSSGIDMLHMCPLVNGAKKLTDDGLFWGGDPGQAQDVMSDPSLDRVHTGFDFKFFVQSTRWLPLQLEKEVRDGTWFVASVSKEILFKSRDRMGTRRAKPLWTEIMELMGGEYKEVRDQLYGED